ncbi:MAG: endonuclease III domain-containing protein [Candidatus Omnitrophica bacterium]|nr:endonuclease III domain-containing protein [Candidatus Omnitrophota bacterium]MDD5027153.1 endonuclease III domain-containing protein [Candidatus Omnitrophota bacterium]MDD5661609.1 endonuclease III domain-containing protein [Candidatus Omnitrophota bacterium]
MSGVRPRLNLIYRKLYSHFGPQRWWPADTAFEVMVGAILTQNTSWPNVEKAISNLKKHKVLKPARLDHLPVKKLAKLIRSAGFYNIKAKRLKEFLNYFINDYGASIKKISKVKVTPLRKELLAIKGVGPETADSILLYALHKPVFVIDAYTRRIFSRHKFIKEDATYDQIQRLFRINLKKDVKLFNEYHALLVALAKNYCLKSTPKCSVCPLDFC